MMRPYNPHISPEVAQEVMILTADIVSKHGMGDANGLLDHAAAAWRTTVERIVYGNLVDNMEDAKQANSAQEGSPKYAAACSQALDDVIAPLHTWTGHDWIGKVLGTVDPTKDDALDHLFRSAARMVAKAGLEQGVAAKGSLAKFLSHEHITTSAIGDMLMTTENTQPTVRAEDKPYIEFIERLAKAAFPLLGTTGSDEKIRSAAAGDEDAAKQLLLFAGYAGDSLEIASTLYGAKLYLPQIQLAADPETTRSYSQDELRAAGAPQAEPASKEPPIAAGALASEPLMPTAIEALDYVRQNTGLKDTDMAECLGVSRGTIQNLISGKAKKPMTQEGREKLAEKVGEIGKQLLIAADVLRTGQ